MRTAKSNGVELISVTDHDTALGAEEASKAAEEYGVKFVNGIEVSAYKNGVKLHTLGYNLNLHASVFKDFTEELFKGSVKRAEDIICKLNKNGVFITMDEVLNERKCNKSPVHSMFIARAATKKGYAKTPFNFYSEYLSAGKCAYSEIGRPSPEKAVEVIKLSGGISSLAHPARIEMEDKELLSLIKELKACGLDGIEAEYSAHTAVKTAYFKEIARQNSLLVTGGSDTHFKGGNRKIGTPAFFADKILADKLLT